jgi:hypothetical protein
MYITSNVTEELVVLSLSVTGLYDWSVSGRLELHITQVYAFAGIYALHTACRACGSVLICTSFRIVTGCPFLKVVLLF